MTHDSDSTVDLGECLRGTWRGAALGGVLGAVAGLVVASALPKWYTAALAVVPAGNQKSSLGLTGTAAALGMSDLPIDLGGTSDVDRISAIFHISTVTDAVIAKFNLNARYDEKYIEDTRETLWKHCSTKIEKKSSMVTISCEDKVPATAQAMVLYFADRANQVARRVSTSSAGEERRFLETRVAQAREDLDKASSALRDFQEQNRIVSLPEQAKAVVTSIATLRAEMLEKQMQLAYVDGFSAADESTSQGLRRQVGILQNKLKSLEESRSFAKGNGPAHTQNGAGTSGAQGKGAADPPANSSLFPPAMNVPQLQYQLEHLLREQKVQETLFGLLTQRFEMARVSEARDTSTIQVLDSPPVPTKKSRPKRTLFALGAGLFGALVGFGFAVMWRKRGERAAPAASAGTS